ncbi:MAG: hypothetical protein SFV19_07065, partial [Rhodospirillaceae bacterium]|nr:hypothetical protein [Rhodospirillaceae bacterium]
EPGISTVSGHNSFKFRRDWSDFRSDLSEFREVAQKQSARELSEAASDLRRSVAAINSYSPTNVGAVCDAFRVAKVKFNAAVPQLDQVAANADWLATNALATDLTETSEQLREALPTWWFTRHRHGRHFH